MIPVEDLSLPGSSADPAAPQQPHVIVIRPLDVDGALSHGYDRAYRIAAMMYCLGVGLILGVWLVSRLAPRPESDEVCDE